MENTVLQKIGGRWRLSYPLYVELGTQTVNNECSPELVTMLEKSLKRLLFKQALLHCTDEFRHLIRRIIRVDKRVSNLIR